MTKQSIKEQVVQLAEKDPFLTIEQIANQAKTTPRYVRTILSEARVSLNELRRNYARSMESRLGYNQGSRAISPEVVLGFRLFRKKDPLMCGLFGVPSEHELCAVSEMQKSSGIPTYTELFTYLDLQFDSRATSVRDFLGEYNGELTPKGQQVEVVKPHEELCYLFSFKSDQHLLKLSTLLYNRQKLIAIEVQWVPAAGVLLKWDSHSPTIKVAVGD